MKEKLRRLICVVLASSILVCGTLTYGEILELDDESIGQEAVDASVSDEDIYSGSVLSGDYPTLKKGDKDKDDSGNVVRLQTRLIQLNYLSDEADGSYGGNTVDAVSSFQKENGLEVTGIADPVTQNLLYSDNAKEAPMTYDSTNVVARVQKKLIEWGFLIGTADGKIGDQTRQALARFNSYIIGYMELYPTPAPEPTKDPGQVIGLSDGLIVQDALLEPESDESINDLMLEYVDGVYDFNIYRKTVQDGDSKDDEVYRVQRRLRTLGYLYVVDGDFGETTQRALLYFQKKNNLSQNGIADEATQRVLFSENAVKSEEFINPYKIIVDVSEQRVYIFQWNGSDYSTCLGKTKCSTGLSGKETETPRGTFQAGGPSGTGLWYHFKTYHCYAKWGYFIVGGIMFHSVVYTEQKKLIEGSVDRLGRKASHGCVRLPIKAAKWIYENCPKGTTVVIQD